MSVESKELTEMRGVLNETLQKCKEVAEGLEKHMEVNVTVDTMSDVNYLFDNTADNKVDSVEVKLLLEDISKTSLKLRDDFLELLSSYSTLVSVSEGDFEIFSLLARYNNVISKECQEYIKLAKLIAETGYTIPKRDSTITENC